MDILYRMYKIIVAKFGQVYPVPILSAPFFAYFLENGKTGKDTKNNSVWAWPEAVVESG